MVKILYVCNTAGILARFRLPLLKAARAAGYEVSCVCGLGTNADEYFETLKSVGISVRTLPGLEENGLSLRTLLLQAIELAKMISDDTPDILHSFTHRANIVSFFSLKGNRTIRFIPNVTGAGRVFGDNLSLRDRMVRRLILNLYRYFEHRCECIYFQNSDDLQEIALAMGWSPLKAKLTNGSGLDPLDLSSFSKTNSITKRKELFRIYGIEPHKKMFIMPSRALHSKGVAEFYKAAERYLELFNDAVFVHAGESVDYNVDGFNQATLESMQLPGLYYIGFQRDIYSLINASDIVVLPSFYREGIPRALIEALAFGKVIITSDRPGCRETVVDGWNGKLVEHRTSQHLLSAMVACRTMDLVEAGKNSRLLFDKRFHAARIIEVYLQQYNNLT